MIIIQTNKKGKTDVEGEGDATCAHRWRTANICEHKTAGKLYVEINHHDCGSPPLLGEDWSGLKPPMLSTEKR